MVIQILKKFNIRYNNIPLSKFKFQSKSKSYVNEFIKIEERHPSDLIEIQMDVLFNFNKFIYVYDLLLA